MDDFFRSHTISLILTWLVSVPLLMALVTAPLTLLRKRTDDIPRLYMAWLGLCIIAFSPVRYMVLQIFMATAYPLQSFRALFTCLPLAAYVPIIFGILYGIGFGLPLMGSVAIALAHSEVTTKARLWLSALLAPFIFMAAGYVYFLLLPYAAYSIWMAE